jgi:guanylate kinase
MIKKGTVIVFSAASGAGKTTLLDHLRVVMPELVYSISATTRKPRTGEVDGVHYFFMTVDEFKNKIDSQSFAEWAVVHGNYYGTPKSFIDQNRNAGRHIIMDIDVIGKKMFDSAYPDAIGVFIQPPSLDALGKRLRNRGTDSEEVIRLRIVNAKKEIRFAQEQGKYEYSIINEDLVQAKRDVVALVARLIADG